MDLRAKVAPALLTTGLVVWLEGLITIEWSYPYCVNPSDGPAYGAYGMPLPYWMWNGVASLEHDFVPHVYVLNIVILSLLLFPLVWWIWKRLFGERPTLTKKILASFGALLLIIHVALTSLMIWMGWYWPTTSLSSSYRSYSEFRPVRIGRMRGNAPVCEPSRFWFPNGWQPRR